jgi:hypothetical protein
MGRPQSPFYPKFGQASTLLANLIKLFGVMHASTGAPIWVDAVAPPIQFWIALGIE